MFTTWELHTLMILGMVSQVSLIFWTYLRKRSSSWPLGRIFWLACYLAAEYVAARSLGTIFQKGVDLVKGQENQYLLGVWAHFLLLHLGGYSKLSAFTLEDNEVWSRHMIRFLFYELLAIVVCIKVYEKKNGLILIISFLTGSLRFFERVYALKKGSRNGLRNSALEKSDLDSIGNGETDTQTMWGGKLPKTDPPNVIDLDSTGNGETDTETMSLGDSPETDPQNVIDLEAQQNNDRLGLLGKAHESFERYKGLYVDNICTLEDPFEFGSEKMTAKTCIEFMDMELNFAYEFFYSKSSVSETTLGLILKVVNFGLLIFAAILFIIADKSGLPETDVQITYSLIILALIVKVFSILECLLSNQIVVDLNIYTSCKELLDSILMLHELKDKFSVRWNSFQLGGTISSWWTRSRIGQYNLFTFCFNDSKTCSWVKYILQVLELKEFWDSYWYIHYVCFDDELKMQILRKIKTLPNNDYLLPFQRTTLKTLSNEFFSQMNIHVDSFEKCILTWHIVTDVCYIRSEANKDKLNSFIVSNYMLYLLLERPSMLSSVVAMELTSYKQARTTALLYYTQCPKKPRDWDGKYNANLMSVVSNAARIAEELLGYSPEQLWESLFNLWVEILCYAAIHSKGKYHAEVLGTGGEFFSSVWLYTVHLNMHLPKIKDANSSESSSPTNNYQGGNQEVMDNNVGVVL